MSKRSKGKKGAEAEGAPDSKLSHNPFGSLASLGASVPAGDVEVEATPEEPLKPDRFPNKLVVRMEKKGRRGKTVTRISGIPGRDIQALAVEMKRALGCGATVEGAELILQGSLVDRAASWLEKQGARQLVKGN